MSLRQGWAHRAAKGVMGVTRPLLPPCKQPQRLWQCHLQPRGAHPGDVVLRGTPGSSWLSSDPYRGDVVIRAVPSCAVPYYPWQLEHMDCLVPGEWCPQGHHVLCDPAPGLMPPGRSLGGAELWGGTTASVSLL